MYVCVCVCVYTSNQQNTGTVTAEIMLHDIKFCLSRLEMRILLKAIL